MRRLAPLMLSFLVTMSAVLGGRKCFGVDEFTGIGGHERRQEVSILAEVVVILLHDLGAIGSSGSRGLVCFTARGYGPERN